MKECNDISNTTIDQNAVIKQTGSVLQEYFNEPSTIAIEPDANLHIRRGQYRVRFHINDSDVKTGQLVNEQVSVPFQNTDRIIEYKRVFFHKIDFSKDDNVPGRINATAVVTVMDNQFIIGGLVLGAAVIGSFIAGNSFIDKVEEYQSTTLGQLTTIGIIGAVAFGIYLFIRYIK